MRYTPTRYEMTFLLKCAMDSWASIGASARAVQSLDGQSQESILIELFRESSSPPCIKTRRRDAEFPAHPAHRKISILLIDRFKFYRLRAAKYAAIFLETGFPSPILGELFEADSAPLAQVKLPFHLGCPLHLHGLGVPIRPGGLGLDRGFSRRHCSCVRRL